MGCTVPRPNRGKHLQVSECFHLNTQAGEPLPEHLPNGPSVQHPTQTSKGAVIVTFGRSQTAVLFSSSHVYPSLSEAWNCRAPVFLPNLNSNFKSLRALGVSINLASFRPYDQDGWKCLPDRGPPIFRHFKLICLILHKTTPYPYYWGLNQ